MNRRASRAGVAWLVVVGGIVLIRFDRQLGAGPAGAVSMTATETQQPSGSASGGAAAQPGPGGRGRGGGGLPPLPPMDENAPPPPLVVPGARPGDPPSDAVVIFDGTDMSQWTLRDGSPARCQVENREMVCRTGDQSIVSKPTFASAQVHIEYNVPEMEAVRDGKSNAQVKGNSGVFLHGRYEIQILDSYNNLNRTYPDGSNAALYRVAAPLVNVSRRAGEWQTYDIITHAPTCEDGRLTSPGDITVLHNGVLVQDRVVPRVRNDLCEPGMTELRGPLMLQDHIPNGGPMTVMRVPQHLVPGNQTSQVADIRRRVCNKSSYGPPSRSCAPSWARCRRGPRSRREWSRAR